MYKRQPQGPVYDLFVADYLDAFNQQPDSFAALTYDATWLAIYGVGWAEYQREGQLTGLDLAYGLQKVSNTKGVAVKVSRTGWPIVQQEFREGRGVDITGVSGDLQYDPVTEECTAPFSYWKINDAGTDFEDL